MADRGPPAPKPPTACKPAKNTTPVPQAQTQQGREAVQCVQQESVQNSPDEVPNQVPPQNPPAEVSDPIQPPNPPAQVPDPVQLHAPPALVPDLIQPPNPPTHVPNQYYHLIF